MNQPVQPRPQRIKISDVVQLCLQTMLATQDVMKKDPKLITEKEFMNILEGLKMVSTFVPDIYHVIKSLQEQQKIKIISGNEGLK